MKIIIITIIILVVVRIYLRFKYINPINSIKLNGTLSFELGQSESSAIRAFKIGMVTESELRDYQETRSPNRSKIETLKNTYNHIDSVLFFFENSKIKRISIIFDKDIDEVRDFFDDTFPQLYKRLGKPDHVSFEEKKATWGETVCFEVENDKLMLNIEK